MPKPCFVCKAERVPDISMFNWPRDEQLSGKWAEIMNVDKKLVDWCMQNR